MVLAPMLTHVLHDSHAWADYGDCSWSCLHLVDLEVDPVHRRLLEDLGEVHSHWFDGVVGHAFDLGHAAEDAAEDAAVGADVGAAVGAAVDAAVDAAVGAAVGAAVDAAGVGAGVGAEHSYQILHSESLS